MDSGFMLFLDSTPLLHDTIHIHNFQFGLFSENYPLQSKTMYNTLKSDSVDFHYIGIISDEEKIDKVYCDEFFTYKVVDHYMTSVKTFLTHLLPYVNMYSGSRDYLERIDLTKINS
jgi:hypothetical protein